MEKIIAVVIMLVIVIGLIATVILPKVSQINEMGDQSTEQMNQFMESTKKDRAVGKSVKQDFKSALNDEKKKVVVYTFAENSGFNSDSDNEKIDNVDDLWVFVKSKKHDNSEDVTTITYTQIDPETGEKAADDDDE